MDNGLAGFTDFTPKLAGAFFVFDIDVFAALGFDQVMDGSGRYHHKIRLVVMEAGGRVGVGDDEAGSGQVIGASYSIIAVIVSKTVLGSVLKMATKIMPVSDLRRQTSQVIQSILRDGDVVYVTQRGRPTVVLVDYEQYEALLARLGDQSDMTTINPAAAGSARDFATFPADAGVSIAVELSAEEARRLVNRTIVPELGTGLGAKEPDLMLRGQQVIWRVPIVLSLSGLGELGEVGIIEVDAQTGEIVSGETAQERILQHAQRLYAGATLPAE